MGEVGLANPVQESQAVAVKTGAVRPAKFTRLFVGTTVRDKAIAVPFFAPSS